MTVGNVHVGTVGHGQALRYDIAHLPSSGRTFVLPDATLTFPLSLESSTVVGPRGVTLDADGALWAAATSNQLLFRLTDPAVMDGTVTPDVTTTWADQGATVGASLVWTTRTSP